MFVDDATSSLTACKFAQTETTEAYLQTLESHLLAYGKPEAFYVDKHSIFRVGKQEVKKGEAQTHFGRVLDDLGIRLICAHSPQAKGRVKRANGTLQDRLIKEMRLEGISNMTDGNAFLTEFVPMYNEKFAKTPPRPENAHRSLGARDNLERIFARKDRRKLSKNLGFQYNGVFYQLKTDRPNRIRKDHVEILHRDDRPLSSKSKARSMHMRSRRTMPINAL